MLATYVYKQTITFVICVSMIRLGLLPAYIMLNSGFIPVKREYEHFSTYENKIQIQIWFLLSVKSLKNILKCCTTITQRQNDPRR